MSIHPAIKANLQVKPDGDITIKNVKFSYKHLEVIDSMIATDSVLLLQEMQKGFNPATNAPVTVEQIAAMADHQDKVIQKQVIAINDEPYTLTDEDLKATPRENRITLFTMITITDQEEADDIRRFHLEDQEPETSDASGENLPEGRGILNPPVEADSTQFEVQPSTDGN